jgi:uncharacterized membrane protein YfbV (UPF0208 family)
MSDRHPVRLIVQDDLRRSRLTVFFRILLAIPHVLWAGLFAVVAVVVAIVNWFATLIRGQSPRDLHRFLAGYIRYVTHIEAYLFLVANPYPGFFLGSGPEPYPIDVEIDDPQPQNRWKTAFRLPLVIPAALVNSSLAGFGGGGRGAGYNTSVGLLGVTSVLTWFSALARGQAPRGLRDLGAWGLGYSAQTAAYVLLLTDRYPYAGPEAHLRGVEPAPEAEGRARFAVTDDLRRSRLTVLFRLPLTFPHIVWLLLWSVAAVLAAIVNWFATLLAGRSPEALSRFLAAYVRYGTHVSAFLHLIGNPFPGFVGKAGSYPVEPELVLGERQNRWVTGFRIVLAVPALMVSGALWGVLAVCAFLGWFASLARAQMPEGLRNAGAHALRYSAQLGAYLLVLTDRYPFGAPVTADAPAAEPVPSGGV